ncbi:hypothetical protein BDZ94DRAFT_1261218 [Collybia nuda]|uniref:Uncharacterized protein n=1 Tax=Collybia nuda TaxID=64659 RepID=A0A9P5Y530_9AGAR|nr:hypothetical protein BDZ94DRAFT_1261218 [Collybia nuda]
MSSLLLILAKTDSELDWRRISELLNHHALTQVLVYTSKESELNLIAFLCFYHLDPTQMLGTQPELLSVLASWAGVTFEYRLYQPLQYYNKSVHSGSHILIMNAMTPDPNAEGRFNDWYTEEHIPLLRCIPSWISSERYHLISATTSDVPRHLALHKLGDSSAFDTEQYKTATNTPWRTEVITKVVDKQRLILKYIGELDSLAATSIVSTRSP